MKLNIKNSYKSNLPFLVLNDKEAEKFIYAIENPPVANRDLKKILHEVKKRSPDIFSFFK